ncbi:MAG TPA: ABC transporter substrate-binding protein [Chloroflexota bacterium]
MPIDRLRMGPACYHVLHILPPMVAHEMNFFVDEGLVDRNGRPAYDILPGGLSPFNAEKTSLAQSMKEKGAHIAMDVKPSSVVYLNRRGANLRIIAGWRNQQPNWVMGKPEIRSLAELRGQLVGLKDFGNIRYWALAYRIQQAGLNPQQDVRYIRGMSDGATALRNGKVDAAFVTVEDGPEMLDEGFTKLVDLSILYPEGRPDRIIVATDDFLNERPDWANAYVKGMIRAYWFMRIMPDNFNYLNNLERRMRHQSFDPEEQVIPLSCRTPLSCELMPFPIDGQATGFDTYLKEWVELGELDEEDVAVLQESVRQDIAREAFSELQARAELKSTLERAREVASRIGY